MANGRVTIEGNEAAARVAYACSEVIAIYPITPSSGMGELSDQWASEGKPNLWGSVPRVVEMQSEGGAAGALHGALQAGALGTTFTASQGLLLMIPNMYKIAGELTPTVFHIAARSIAAQGLSIFGDHQDVMACRQTGWAMLASNSVQEAGDMALIAHAATLETRLPFLHFFDGFRTSHEVATVIPPTIEQIRGMIRDDLVAAIRQRALSPDHPVLRGTAQNPDVYFQARETVNPFYLACPAIVQNTMDRFAELSGRRYRLYDYAGHSQAERVIVMMGSGCGAAEEAVEALNAAGQKVGLVKVRLFRPFDLSAFAAALPESVKAVAVLDRTKEPGALGEPLYQDVLTALHEAGRSGIRIVGGRYGLSSKEFTPAMAKAVFDNLTAVRPRNHFTVGIMDDVTHLSLDYDPKYSTEDPASVRAVFFGLGADGTVGANKNTIKIIGEDTPLHAQGYFVYDSKKSGSVTVSHLRFGPNPIRSTYLISRASFVACHQFHFLERFDMLGLAEAGGTFLLNSPYGPDEVWSHLPRTVQETILEKRLRLFVIDALAVAKANDMGGRINTVMQTCFFALSGVLPRDEAIAAIKKSIQKTYAKRGQPVVERNWAAVDATLDRLFEVTVPLAPTAPSGRRPLVSSDAPEFVRNVTARMLAGEGNALPVSALPQDGTWPTGTSQWEKRNIALEIPVWDETICIQCGKCVLVCPHAVIRGKVFDPAMLDQAPETFKHADARWPDRKGQAFTLQVAPEDCTGCRLCVEACPVKNKSEPRLKAINMASQPPLRDAEAKNWDFFRSLPEPDRATLRTESVKDVQLLRPLFEFSGACAGCGETPYLKMISQLFGDHALIANATGCSSIYGGNLPTTPWAKGDDGCGPAWSNSLFEDNAEFGLGLRLAVDKQAEYARELLARLRDDVGAELADGLLNAKPSSADVRPQRERVKQLKEKLAGRTDAVAKDLIAVADALVPRSVWIVGGDGWAYDIGYGGLDHVLNTTANVNVLVLDTEVYSNTGGQMSKATPRAAVAKFAAAGKRTAKKDLALLAAVQGQCYVARVAFGANDTHTLTALREAESFPGPSLVIAYSPCIAHGFDLSKQLEQQKAAVQSGHWPLFRYDPRRKSAGLNPMQLDSKPPSLSLKNYLYNETRFTVLVQNDPASAEMLLREAETEVADRWKMYERLAATANGGAS
ncbi:MAG: pyruvate:ferredoxin (flavodoxin) oxidoreductase [Gemmataceae bacterium]|nr:pyruvate:ferredoxin (flavodoxin) oxidoreductase [Gemmataceae bacterium]